MAKKPKTRSIGILTAGGDCPGLNAHKGGYPNREQETTQAKTRNVSKEVGTPVEI